MLTSDAKIYNTLIQAKKDGNKLLNKFHIQYPSKDAVAQESNSIIVAVVSSEPNEELLDATEYRDLIEVLIVTKIRDYDRAVRVIKTVTREIIQLLKLSDEFEVRPIVRNISPEYNSDFVLSRGHVLVEVLSSIDTFDDTEEYEKVCEILVEDIEIE